MKNKWQSLIPGLILILISIDVSAQVLIEKSFRAESEAEALLELRASAPGASWIEEGKEAATVRVFLDGRYHQDLILYSGARPFPYQLFLGRVPAGEHSVRVDLNRRFTAAGVANAAVNDARITLIDRSQPEFEPISHAPILYARANTIGRFSDVPLLMYYETERRDNLTVYRYSVIFSNEDGGTQTSGLMARWGRTTDIEWVCETHLDAQGKAVKTIFQGVNHETKEFRGQREGEHPWLLVASDNNNFDDKRVTEMRFALRPVAVDLRQSSREEVMDRHVWIYRVMAEEMIREGKITSDRTLGPLINDLRHYLYLDVHSLQRNGGVISFAVKLTGDPKWYTSNLGINSYKVDRSGYFRTTILLPPGTNARRVERLAVRCDVANNPRNQDEMTRATTAKCDFRGINKLFFLDHDFQPVATLPIRPSPLSLSFGEVVELSVLNR